MKAPNNAMLVLKVIYIKQQTLFTLELSNAQFSLEWMKNMIQVNIKNSLVINLNFIFETQNDSHILNYAFALFAECFTAQLQNGSAANFLVLTYTYIYF